MPMYEAPKLDVGGGGQFLDLETAVKDGILGGGGGGGGIKAVAGETLDLKKMIEELSSVEVPSVFICPISLEPMQDPVTLCTGQTYERANILKWLSMGHAITFAITVGHRHFYSSPPPFNRLQQFGKVGGRSWCSRDHSFQPWSSPTGLCTCYNHGFGGVKLTTTT